MLDTMQDGEDVVVADLILIGQGGFDIRDIDAEKAALVDGVNNNFSDAPIQGAQGRQVQLPEQVIKIQN